MRFGGPFDQCTIEVEIAGGRSYYGGHERTIFRKDHIDLDSTQETTHNI